MSVNVTEGQNGTDTSGWQPNSLIRGTGNILTSCIITLLLCVWSALHLNVNGEEGWKRKLWVKAGWALVAVFAPELVVAIAWLVKKDRLQRTVSWLNLPLLSDDTGMPTGPNGATLDL